MSRQNSSSNTPPPSSFAICNNAQSLGLASFSFAYSDSSARVQALQEDNQLYRSKLMRLEHENKMLREALGQMKQKEAKAAEIEKQFEETIQLVTALKREAENKTNNLRNELKRQIALLEDSADDQQRKLRMLQMYIYSISVTTLASEFD